MAQHSLLCLFPARGGRSLLGRREGVQLAAADGAGWGGEEGRGEEEDGMRLPDQEPVSSAAPTWADEESKPRDSQTSPHARP